MRKGAKGFHIPYSMGSQGAIKSFHMIVMNCSDFSGLSLKIRVSSIHTNSDLYAWRFPAIPLQ